MCQSTQPSGTATGGAPLTNLSESIAKHWNVSSGSIVPPVSPKQSGVCPSCGRCGQCGSTPRNPYNYPYNYPYYYPYYQAVWNTSTSYEPGDVFTYQAE